MGTNQSYNEEITSRGNEEIEKFLIVEYDAQILETLVVKEDEPTAPESHEKKNDEVAKTIPDMTLSAAMHLEVKNEKMNLTTEVDKYIIHLNNELREIIVKKEIKKIILEDYVLELLIEHNYRLLENDGGENY